MAKEKKSKVSMGTGRGAKPVRLTGLELVLMGKGQYTAWRPEHASKSKTKKK